MTAPKSSGSDLAWADAPRDILPTEHAAAVRFVTCNAADDTEAGMFLAMLGLEVAS